MRGRQGRPRGAATKFTRPAARIHTGSGGRDGFGRKVVGSRTGLPHVNPTIPYYGCRGHLVGPRAAGVPDRARGIVCTVTPDPDPRAARLCAVYTAQTSPRQTASAPTLSGMPLIAYSASAAIDRLGFTPGLPGMMDPSTTYKPR